MKRDAELAAKGRRKIKIEEVESSDEEQDEKTQSKIYTKIYNSYIKSAIWCVKILDNFSSF